MLSIFEISSELGWDTNINKFPQKLEKLGAVGNAYAAMNEPKKLLRQVERYKWLVG